MKKTLYFLLFSLLSTPLLSQNEPPKSSPWTEEGVRVFAEKSSESQLVNTCSMLTAEGYLFYAEILVDKLLTINPNNSNYNYRKGFFLLESYRKYNEAIPHFLKATQKINPNVDMFSTRDQSAPTDVLYHLGQCYHYQERLDEAKKYYEDFLIKSNRKSELIPKAQLRLRQLETAERLMKTPVEIELSLVKGNINTPYPDYSSVISFDGSALFFTSRRPWFNNDTEKFKDPKTNQYPEDVYVSYLDFDSTWTEPVRLLFCKPEINEATMAVSIDERRIYVYQDLDGNGDIYYSDFKNNRFRDVEHLNNSGINTDAWEPHCMVSPDGQYLFFSSDREGGYGGLDIYYCIKNDDGEWGKPINLGPEINGPQDDDSPFISISGDQLYFATNDHRSMGGYDIMLSERAADGKWQTAKNIGFPFNRTNDDIYYTTTVDGLEGYLTSYREIGEGEKDIYRIKNNFLPINPTAILAGIIENIDGTPLPQDLDLAVKINCLDCTPKQKSRMVYPRARDGVFMSGLKPCQTYILTYVDLTDGKVISEETIKTDCIKTVQKIDVQKYLDPITRTFVIPSDPKDSKIDTIQNVVITNKTAPFIHYFNYNKNKLSTSSKDLRNYLKDLEENLAKSSQNITLVVNSSASKVPTKKYENNIELATLRAENIKYDLITYFQATPYANRVQIVVDKKEVNGPSYENDARNNKKYKPYQYISISAE